MAAVKKEHVLLTHPDCQVLFAEIPAADSCGDSPQAPAPPTVTLRLLVEVCSGDYGNGPLNVETMEELTGRVPLGDLGRCPDAAFSDLAARIGYQRLRQEVAAQITAAAAAARVRERCGEVHDVDELRGVELRLRVVFFDDAFDEWSDLESDDDESGSDDEVGCGAQPNEPQCASALAVETSSFAIRPQAEEPLDFEINTTVVDNCQYC